jgi:cobalt-zinc-cadmium efflux system membrane fusion protein
MRLARHSNAITGGIIVVAALGFLGALSLGWIDILPHSSHVADESEQSPDAAVESTIVTLPPEKLAVANIRVTTAAQHLIGPSREVPGEIQYDESRRVPLHAPVAGVILQVLAEPGQAVTKGQLLAVLACPEIGMARDAVQKQRADLALARREEQRAAEVGRNVEELLALLRQKPQLADVEAALANRSLGDYREKIVGAYSQLLYAQRASEAGMSLENGSLSSRLIEQRKTEREQAEARFSGACEQARFLAMQDSDRYQAAAAQAERLLHVSQQSLDNLRGPWAALEETSDPNRLNELQLVAPLDGRIVERKAVQNSRVADEEPLFVVADTSTIWVSAEIHERDWSALDLLKPGEPLAVRVPALGVQSLRARIRWVGAQVDAVKRSVPLVAELANDDDRLRPGMYVWTLIPLEKPHLAVTVPSGAIMRHENQPFVFVTEGGGRFRRVDVQTGVETGDEVEIVAGLSANSEVVDRGTFYLKSELLLEKEE